jgi:hypothetical protein
MLQMLVNAALFSLASICIEACLMHLLCLARCMKFPFKFVAAEKSEVPSVLAVLKPRISCWSYDQGIHNPHPCGLIIGWPFIGYIRVEQGSKDSSTMRLWLIYHESLGAALSTGSVSEPSETTVTVPRIANISSYSDYSDYEVCGSFTCPAEPTAAQAAVVSRMHDMATSSRKNGMRFGLTSIIAGVAGSGKTSAALMLAHRLGANVFTVTSFETFNLNMLLSKFPPRDTPLVIQIDEVDILIRALPRSARKKTWNDTIDLINSVDGLFCVITSNASFKDLSALFRTGPFNAGVDRSCLRLMRVHLYATIGLRNDAPQQIMCAEQLTSRFVRQFGCDSKHAFLEG